MLAAGRKMLGARTRSWTEAFASRACIRTGYAWGGIAVKDPTGSVQPAWILEICQTRKKSAEFS